VWPSVSAASLVAGIGLQGLEGYSVREISRLLALGKFGSVKGFIRASILVVLVASLAGGTILAGLTTIHWMNPPTELTWGLMLAPLMAMLILMRAISQGFGRVFDTQAPIELIRPGLMVLALSIILTFAFPAVVDDALKLLVLANMFALALAFLLVYRAMDEVVPSTHMEYHIPEWFKGTAPFFGIGILAAFQAEISTLMLGWLSGAGETGLFQPMRRLVPVMIIAAQAINVPLAPRISELWERGEKARMSKAVRTATLTTTIAVIMTCGALLLLAPWIFAAFGTEFTVNLSALGWLAAAQIFSASCGSVGILLNMTGHQTLAAKALLGAVLANFLLCWWLIPQHGAYGAALALSASIIIWNVLMLIAVRNRLGFDPSILGVRLS
jgi:O-antigen/teichoic acid export membrane protein